jgi:alpha/beta superfamily hydrolase
MASAPTATTCANHKKRERVATCGVCESPLCIDCVVHTPVGVKCRKCTGGAAATAPRASAAARASTTSGTRGGGGGQRRWPVPVAIVGGLFIVIAAVAVINRGGGHSSTSVSATATTVAAAAEGANTGGTSQAAVVDRPADFIGGGRLKIGATLTVPANLGNKTAPGVLIVPGGSAQDRNGGLDLTTQLPDPLYQDLAQSFAQSGMVALRYDRRGTGVSQLGPGVPLTWDGLIADAKAGLDFLAQRKETERQPITIVGYDQGGFVAMRVAETDPAAKGLVLISTPGRGIGEVVANDLSRAIPDPAKAQMVADTMRASVAQVVSTGTVPAQASLPDELKPIFSADPSYLKGLFSFDPIAEGAKVKVPTLIVRGGNDGSILPADVSALQAAIAGSLTLISPLGSNTLALPPGQEGRFHDPARHGTTRDGDAELAIDDWIHSNVK